MTDEQRKTVEAIRAIDAEQVLALYTDATRRYVEIPAGIFDVMKAATKLVVELDDAKQIL